MDQNLKTELVHSIFQFKKLASSGLGMDISENKKGINMTELILMNEIVDNSHDSQNNVELSDIKEFLLISKGAVSQIIGSLEKKGFINRNIDKNNRRKLIVTLTPEGRQILEYQYKKFVDRLETIIGRLGEEDVKQMIIIVNRMIKITNEIDEEKSD